MYLLRVAVVVVFFAICCLLGWVLTWRAGE